MLRCAILVSIFTLSRSFLISRTCVLNRVRLFDNDATAGCADKWPGDRPPIGNLLRIEQTMDASWGRGKYRTEVWEGNDNPVDDWWEAYTPSKEEQEAAAAGYDFSHPKQWFEVMYELYKTAAVSLFFFFFFFFCCCILKVCVYLWLK